MPAIERPVHESTERAAAAPYGCHNHPPRLPGYYVIERGQAITNGHDASATQSRLTWISTVMSTECRHDRSLTDPRCTDCKHAGSGEAYDQSVKAAAAKA